MATIQCKSGVRSVPCTQVYWLHHPQLGLLEIAGGRIDQIPADLRKQMEAASGQTIEIAEADLTAFTSIYNEMMEACTPKCGEESGHKYNKSWARGW